MDNHPQYQPQAPTNVPPAYPQQAYQQQAPAPAYQQQMYAQTAYQQQAPAPTYQPQAPAPTYQQQAPVPVQPPAVKPKKGWGMMFAAFALVPLFIVGEIAGLYLGDYTPLGEDIGAELGGALFMLIPCLLLGGAKVVNITKDSFKWAWRALWWSIAISAGIAIYDLWATIDAGEFVLASDWPWQFFLSVIFCIFIGFLEEFMVRGLVLNGLLARMGKTRKGIVWACILSSIFFGLLHVDATAIGSSTPLEILQGVLKVLQTGMYGFALAAVVCKTGEIVSAALLHGLDDWLLFVLTFVMGENPFVTEYVSEGAEEGWATAIVYIICILLYIPLVVRAIKTLKNIDTPNRGAFFRERKGVVEASSAPSPAMAAASAAGVVSAPQVAPQVTGYAAPAAQTYQQQAPAPVPPAGFVPTQIPDQSLYQTGQNGPQRM